MHVHHLHTGEPLALNATHTSWGSRLTLWEGVTLLLKIETSSLFLEKYTVSTKLLFQYEKAFSSLNLPMYAASNSLWWRINENIFFLSQLMAIWLCHPAIQYHLSWDPLWRLATKYRNGSDLWLDDKIVKVNKLYLNSLLVSIVNRVFRSGTMKYQCKNTDESNKKWLLT